MNAAPLAGIDNETYLRGTQILVSAQAATAIEKEGLQRAAFWVAFRQEFHKALLKQRAFSFNLDCCMSVTYGTLDVADDSTWANRMVLHCADILGYCYGERSVPALDAYNALLEYNHTWQRLAPSIFSPIYSKKPDRSREEIFPEIWYLDDCTGMLTWALGSRHHDSLLYLFNDDCSHCHPAFTSGKDPTRSFRSKSSPTGSES